jgi:hypothetical protein
MIDRSWIDVFGFSVSKTQEKDSQSPQQTKNCEIHHLEMKGSFVQSADAPT